ncbi:MAG: hypothetical protein BGO76_05525 [Caedibacter sp. 38-128]|nr:ComEC/Rec2 family competence protein [Holosporales bacterium]OJX03508.1 MAG: hypothetical protein BGO76_05525 [Caedibacter sp. 38-128]
MAASFLAIKFSEILSTKLIEERPQWVLWAPVGIGMGILIYFGMQTEPSWCLGVIGLLFSFFCSILLRILKTEHLGIYFLVLMSLTIFLGFSAAQLRTYSLKTYLFNYPSRVQTIRGEIKKIEQMPKGLRLTLENVTLSPIKLKHPLGRIRINFKGKISQEGRSLVPGQKVQFKGVLLPPNAPVAPGAYDFRKKAYFEQISAVGYGITFPEVIGTSIPQGFKGRVLIWLTKMRHTLTGYLKTTIKENSGAIAAALITGDRSGISEDLRQDFANSGLAHILAISGLHLSIVAGLAFLIFRKGLSFIPWLALRYPIKKWAAAFAIILTFFYLLLCDFAIPAQRAFMMTAIILLAVITDRTAITLRNVALAAIVILLLLPESIISPSFQMSFSAVIALVSGYEILRKPLENWRTNYRQWWQSVLFYLCGITFSSILATIATTPYIAYTFNRFTLHSLPANIVCIPLLSFIIMPALVLYLFLSSFTSGDYLALFLQKAIGVMTEIAHTISLWPGSTLLVPSIPSYVLLVFTLSFLWICLWKTSWRWWGGLGIAMAFILASFTSKPDIFIAGDKNLICILDAKGSGWVNSLQAGRFARENWLKMVALQQAQKFSEDPEEQPMGIQLTKRSYIISKNGKTVMILKDPQGRDFPHIKSDLEILPSIKQASNSSTLITGYELKMKGGHFIWLTKNGVKVRTVRDEVGIRPWSLKVLD